MNEIATTTIDALMDRYQVLLLDAYGVLVHLSGALPGATALIDALNRRGKPYYVVTNDASKLPATAARRYRGFGLAIGAERILSAGSLLKGYFDANGLTGRPCVVLGPEDSIRYVELAGGRIVAPGEPFDVLVVGDETGFPFLETVDAVLTGLIAKFDRGREVALILPNPDLIYPKAEGAFGVAAGGIALMLEAALRLRYPGRPGLGFVRLGKPHGALFEEAARRCGSRDMLMIGDQAETDIRGARAFGIDSALLGGGVAGSALPLAADAPRPTYYLASIAPRAC